MSGSRCQGDRRHLGFRRAGFRFQVSGRLGTERQGSGTGGWGRKGRRQHSPPVLLAGGLEKPAALISQENGLDSSQENSERYDQGNACSYRCSLRYVPDDRRKDYSGGQANGHEDAKNRCEQFGKVRAGGAGGRGEYRGVG